MSVYVALLRGVNVGGANLLPMSRLRTLFEIAGAERTATFIQSGNVVFDAAGDRAETVVASVRAALEREFGYRGAIVTRHADGWRSLVARNPFLSSGADPATLHLGCFSGAPDAARLARLDPRRSPPDRFVVVGEDVYLWLPHGVARSKLTNAWFDATLGVYSTMRSWRTVERIAAMLRGKALAEFDCI